MNLVNLFFIALRAIWRNKSRSILTMLGVIIGVSAVSMLIAIGSGLQRLVVEQFEDFGSNNIFVIPGDIESGGFSEDSFIAQANNKLRYRHVESIRREKSYIDSVSPLSLQLSNVSFQQAQKRTSIVGVDAGYFSITNTRSSVGGSFTDSHAAKKDNVAFLGAAIAEDLFGDIDPVNKKINLNNKTFTVLGVAEAKGGGIGGPSLDDYVYIPFSTWTDIYDSEEVFRIVAKANSDNLEPAKTAITATLSRTLSEDEFSVSDQSDLLSIINQILGGLTAGLGGIAAISLVVGGIGIMNIMLVSVTERTREIGLRKALGATPRVILTQFLIESVLLSVTGGLLGVLVAFLGTLAISQFIPAKITMFAVGLAFSVSALVGVVFGVFPARKASLLSPIEALRYE